MRRRDEAKCRLRCYTAIQHPRRGPSLTWHVRGAELGGGRGTECFSR